jgi:hypothetical protein
MAAGRVGRDPVESPDLTRRFAARRARLGSGWTSRTFAGPVPVVAGQQPGAGAYAASRW